MPRPALWHRNNFAVVPSGVTTAASPFYYDFTNVLESFTAVNATLTAGSTFVTVTPTTLDPIIRRTVSFAGSQYPYVQIRLLRTGGTGWDGKIFYTTAGHSESGSFYAQMTEPVYGGSFQWITVDMRSLTAGGTDWTDNIITGIRIDLGITIGDTFQIDAVVFRGTIYPVAGLYQYTQTGYYNDDVNFFTTAGATATGATNNINSTLATLTTSYQYVGYFLAPSTGLYRFGIASDDAGYLFIGDTALTGYTTANAIIAQPGLRGAAYTYSRNYLLRANNYYPIRFITGNNGGAGGQAVQWSVSGGAFTNDGTGEYFYNADVGLLLDESYTINVSNVGSTDYALSGSDRNGAVSGNDPAISFKVGSVVNFVVNATGHPFWVKTAATTGTTNEAPGLTNGGAAVGTVTWRPASAGTFYYICQFHGSMVGTITVVA
jgi:plastocyanin